MADSEKLMALKKAYAEIILNTAKEAAARIMVSERKAVRYQQELLTAKDEALRMLLRLKQMMDSKVRDAEITSLNQKKKIEELEAQLQEAEDIVKDLREELEEVQAELEVKNNQLQSLEEPKLRCDTHVPQEMPQENRINISVPTVIPITDSQSELVTSSDKRTSTFGKKYEGNNCCSRNVSQVDSCYVHNSDLASIVIRSKEPELYRNGCTQRIRACERKLLDEKLSLSEQINDVKNETAVRGEEVVKELCETLTVKVDVCGTEKNSDIFKAIKEYEDSVPSQAVKSFRRKRKRATRQKKGKTPSFRCIPDQVTETLQATDISCSKTIYSVINDHQSADNSSKSFENEAQKDPESSLVPELPSEARETMIQPVYIEGSGNDVEALTNKPELARQEIAKAENSEVLCNRTDVQPVEEISAISDAKASRLDDELPSQRPDNRFLKYTFRRKRKREPLNSSDGNSSLDNGTVKKKTTEKQNGSLETEKTTLATESSRQSRRLAQVARQLISLSGKKW